MIYNELYKQCDKAIWQYFNTLKDIPEPLFSAMKYSVIGGGKRLRPIFALIGGSLGKIKDEDIMKLAISVELIHCYSLIHDDLPAMDNDTLRRGKPTTHIEFNEGIAILAGDALLNQAYELMSELALLNNNFAKAVNYITKQSGSTGMIAGQCIDISINDNNIDLILNMYCLKTACLFKAALVGGAIAAGAEQTDIDCLIKYADNLGIAYQIADDILDITGTDEVLGKNAGSDQSKNKPTYVSIVGINEARKAAKTYENNALSAIKTLKIKSELEQIVSILINREK